MPQWRSSATLDALQRVIDLAGTMPAVVARRAELSTSELQAMRHLAYGSLGPADLARHLGVTSAASSGIVDRLVARGHAERKPHPDDRRRTEVLISESGRRALVTELAPMFAALARIDAGLSDADRAVVDRFLADVLAAIRSAT